MVRILAADDEPDMLELVRLHLERSGHEVLEAADGAEALRLARRYRPRLAVLDIMMPYMSGLEVCRALKADPATASMGVLFLSARGEEEDVVAGLEMGADDYLAKPFSPRILRARVAAVLRRLAADESGSGAGDEIRVGPLAIRPEERRVAVDGRPVELTAREFDILVKLVSHPGRIYTRRQLGAEEGSRTVDVHVKSIRAKLGVAADLLATVRGVGYRLEAE